MAPKLEGRGKREGEKEEKRGRESAGKLCEWVRVDLGLRRTYETAVDDTCSLCTRHKAQGTRQAHAKLLSLSYLHMYPCLHPFFTFTLTFF